MKKKKTRVVPLRETLTVEPVPAAFGTSGIRGLVADLTGLECWSAVSGFLAWLRSRGDLAAGGDVFLGGDLRPSTAAVVAAPVPRGAILQAAVRAVRDAGFVPRFCGFLPTPALVLHAMARRAPSIMVTGSHIPFDRNGLKLVAPAGEVTRGDEAPILAAIAKARDRELARPVEESIFDPVGMIRGDHLPPLPAEEPDAVEAYVARYAAFPAGALAGRRVLVWQHSSLARDILPRVLEVLGARAVTAGRLDGFVAVDTEAVDEATLRLVQGLVDAHVGVDAVVSADGDADRPLLFSVENGRARFVPGDLLGMLAAEHLGVRRAAVPANVNDALDIRARERGIALVKTRIGSPHVVAALEEAGWEGNGGFLTAAPLTVPGGGTLGPLPTRDALLPICAVLCASLGRGASVASLVDGLPRRFGRSAVVREFPAGDAREIMAHLSPAPEAHARRAAWSAVGLSVTGADGVARPAVTGSAEAEGFERLRARAVAAFAARDGFAEVEWMEWLDGVRVGFSGGDVAHLRPSGNAPEMRVYAVAATAARAEEITARVMAEHGPLARLRAEAEERIAVASLRVLPRPFLLHGAVQPYAWGGTEFIPSLIGVPNPEGRPFAELWMGAHPRAPAVAELDGVRTPLDHLVAREPLVVLGPDTSLRFAGQLPYLFKVLDVRVMASIQAHPTKAQAEAGWARENAAGVPLDAPQRSYRDENHKPEAHVALTDLWMLHGFRPLEDMAEALSSVPELAPLLQQLEAGLRTAGTAAARRDLLRALYGRVMTMPQAEADAMLGPLVARLAAEEARGALGRADPGFWALRAARTFPLPGGHADRGIFSTYLLNLVALKPGQGTFQPAGCLHSYLEGATVEIMANSDNVLRGGLTPKHVDVPELLATLDFGDARPHILEGRAASETGRAYETPAEEFSLERIEVGPGLPWSGGREHGPDSLLVVEGSAAVVAAGRTLVLARGRASLVPANVPYSVAARSPRAVIFKAGVPAA